MAKKYDFAGWATKNDVRCADGRIIRKNAFAEQDGARVPLFWNHQHNDPEMVLGHAILMNREDGVYAEGFFNNSAKAQHVKESIAHGDLLALSIYANQLKQDGSNVLHGIIRELSVVPGGANPEALIETAMLAHGDLWDDEVMVVRAAEDEILRHSSVEEDDEEEEEVKAEEKAEEKPKKKKAHPVKAEKVVEESEDEEDEDEAVEDEEELEDDEEEEEKMKHSATEEKTVGDVLKTLNEDQKKAVAVLIDAIAEEDDEDEDADDEAEDETDNEEEDSNMKHNVFENAERNYGPVLSHSDMQAIFEDWKRVGSLKEAVKHQLEDGVLAHTVYNHNEDGTQGSAQTYGMADINYLFPDARTLQAEPEFISRQMDWVKKVMNGTRHTPFSRVKSIFADITMDEARAKGYTKGGLKTDEVFALLKRVTTPQTIYKRQKLDRDDILDITDFNVVAWIKAEMRMMLEEEAARAILVGDGRSTASADKISEDHIRPIYKDASLYTIRVNVAEGSTDAETADAIIKAAVRGRKNYRGSGNTVMFTTASWHTEMALLEDKMGRPLYDTDEKLRNKMRVSDIVDVEPMENQTYNGKELAAIIVDLRDYNVGADKGGEVNFFDDFDLDYNRERYLIESRFSGALVKPYSAIVIELGSSSSDTDTN